MNILVTGASSGFGAAITKIFVENGHYVIALARRGQRLKELQVQMGKYGAQIHPIVIDVRERAALAEIIATLPAHLKSIDVLVNNAGLALGLELAQDASFNDWENMIATNITALSSVTHLLLPDMVARDCGHIINIGSIAGRYPYPGGNVYGATKAFVKQFSLNLRADLSGTQIRVSNIEPGLCGGTEFSNIRFRGDDLKASKLYENVDYLSPDDIANTVYWVATLPKHININALEIMPVAQSFAALNISRKQV